MKLTNEEAIKFMNGLNAMLNDYENGKSRDLPLLSSVRLTRTVNDLKEVVEVVTKAQRKLQNEIKTLDEKLREQVRKEELSKEDYESQISDKVDNVNEQLQEVMSNVVDISFTDLPSMEDFERIDKSTEGLPAYAAGAVMIAEKLNKESEEDDTNTK